MIYNLFVLCLFIMIFGEAQAVDGYGEMGGALECGTKPSTYSSIYADRRGPCNGRTPRIVGAKNKTLKLQNRRLECTTGVSRYNRGPQPIPNVDKWQNHIDMEKFQAAQEVAKQKPDITWQGDINYKTIEKWEYTDYQCTRDTSCGTENYTTTCEESVYDSDGKYVGTNTKSCTKQRYKLCWNSYSATASYDCSREKIKYQAQLDRPNYNNWNPDHKKYVSIIPNKYDLLPGEWEKISIYNTSSSFMSNRTVMQPSLNVENAWNKYTDTLRLFNGDRGLNSFACVYGSNYSMKVNVTTNDRNIRKTPNALAVPDSEDDQLIVWLTGLGTDDQVVRAFPELINLVDKSSQLIGVMSDESRIREYSSGDSLDLDDGTEVENVKSEAPTGSNKAFWKNTHFRVSLYEQVPGARDIQMGQHIFTDAAESGDFENIRVSLSHGDIDKDIYRATGPFAKTLRKFWQSFAVDLRPDQKYYLEISMYQEGVWFYSSEEDNSIFNSDAHWSDDLVVQLRTEKFDERSLWRKYSDWRKDPLWKKLGLAD